MNPWNTQSQRMLCLCWSAFSTDYNYYIFLLCNGLLIHEMSWNSEKICLLSCFLWSMVPTKYIFLIMDFGFLINFMVWYLSLRMVHTSPPRQASISMYRYLLSLNVLYNLKTNRNTEFNNHEPLTRLHHQNKINTLDIKDIYFWTSLLLF